MGICCTDTEPTGTDGTGEPSRAVDCSRGAEAASELRLETRDEEGTACGFVGSEASFAMLGTEECVGRTCARAGAPSIALRKLEITSCNERIGSMSSELLERGIRL